MYYTDFLEVKNDENCKNINQKDKTFFIGDAKYTYDKTNGFYPMYDPNNPLRDIPFFEGRGNIGAISLNLPLIFEEAKVDSLNFFDHLIYYLELIRNLHKRTKIFIEKKNKTINEFAFIYGGIKDVSKNNLITTKSFSASLKDISRLGKTSQIKHLRLRNMMSLTSTKMTLTSSSVSR